MAGIMLRELTDRRFNHALEILTLRGSILDVAREVTGMMRLEGIPGAVIGGVAVVLHGYVRTTQEIDIFLEGHLDSFGRHLTSSGFHFDRDRRQFVRDEVPLFIVALEQLVEAPREIVEIGGITTVSLADLIGMKLRSGTNDFLRAKDLGDAVGLIRHHRLTGEFATKLEKSVRPAFRKVIKAFKAEASGETKNRELLKSVNGRRRPTSTTGLEPIYEHTRR